MLSLLQINLTCVALESPVPHQVATAVVVVQVETWSPSVSTCLYQISCTLNLPIWPKAFSKFASFWTGGGTGIIGAGILYLYEFIGSSFVGWFAFPGMPLEIGYGVSGSPWLWQLDWDSVLALLLPMRGCRPRVLVSRLSVHQRSVVGYDRSRYVNLLNGGRAV